LNIGTSGQQQLQQRRYCPSVKYRTESAELRRSKLLRRPRTVDHGNTWNLYGDVYGGGYEPSSDSEDNDSDNFGFPSGKSGNAAAPPAPSSSSSSSSLRKSNSSAVRTSASESHIAGHWKKGSHNGHADGTASHQRHSRRRGVKEIYDLTPTRLDLGSPSAGSASGGGGSGVISSQVDPTRMEIAGGREIVSLSRGRTRGSQRKQQRVHSMVDPAPIDSPPNNNNNNSTPSSSNRSINRYSGEVYYEESVGRYGFHVGGGNTLWGSQGLEPSFSIPSNLNEKQYSASGIPSGAAGIGDPTTATTTEHRTQHHGLKRPLSWAGDDPVTDCQLEQLQEPQQQQRQQLARTSSQDRERESPDREMKHSVMLSNGLLPGIEEPPPCPQVKSIHGYLTDFYPEVVAAEQNSVDPSSPSPLNLDNYLSEQLNQFAQQSVRREASEVEEASQLLLSQSPPVQQQQQHHQQQLTVATVIGGLTIAQYEGSPRRYGVRAHPAAIASSVVTANGQDDYSDDSNKPNGPISGSAPTRPLVPGFPRRVTSSPNPAHPQATFSPSATRQTLVDLAAGPAATSTPVAATPEGSSGNHH
jgi:hypothetical protein